jgi:O-antigen/teichoic acid export membrane protein
VRDTWNETKVFTLMALTAILYNKINIFFLQRHGGAWSVAQYSASWQLVDGIAALASNILLGRVLFPLFAKLWVTAPETFTRKARQQALLMAALALPVMFVLMAGSGLIIPLLYGSQYAEAVRIQPWLALCLLISFLHNLAYYLLLSQGRQILVLWFFTAGLALNAALCAWLIPQAPLDGAVAAIVITKAFVAMLTLGACQRSLGLFTWSGLRPLLLTMAGAAALTYGGILLNLALPGQILALALLLAHLWRGWRAANPQEA